MSGPTPKPANRQRAHQGAARPVVVSLAARSRLAPEPPAGLLAASASEWRRLWSTPIAATFVESDTSALARLFQLRDERSRAFRAAGRARLVAGSKGQVRLSPLLGYVSTLDAEIRALEDRFGLTPRARLTLGITLGEAHRSLSELNAEFLEADRVDE
jgi:P27 family predicted phage terminase small subunit